MQQVNAYGVVQPRRYLHKKVYMTEGSLVLEDKNEEIEPGINMEHRMPVKDLKKRWKRFITLASEPAYHKP
jgi:hypothetical protein